MSVLLGTAADEVLAATGGSGNTLNGNGGNDVLIGGAGNDIFDIDYGTLTGTDAGADQMIGGDGDDIYGVDNVSDQVVEAAGEGIDLVIAKVNYTLSANVDNLWLDTAANNGTGNNLVNFIKGNSNSNTLDGGTGADTLDGGLGGSDTYIIDNAGDVIQNVTIASTTDINTVISSVTFDASAGELVNIQIVTLTGLAAVNVTGNNLDNTITGNAASNILIGGKGLDTLDGGGGADVMNGGLDDDVYFVDNVGDSIIEASGSDEIRSTITINLSNANYFGVENLVLIGTANINGTADIAGGGNAITGNSGRNVLTGAGGDDILSSGVLNTGAAGDTMSGGAGNDVYIVFNSNDVIFESAGNGTDTVTIFTDFSLSTGSIANQELENLVLAGNAISGTGNKLVNTITGNSLGNTLDGGANTVGVDTLAGGDGDDLYIVRNVGDFVDEILNQGIDTVQAAFSYTLTTFVENLVLTGSGNIDGTGNDYDNTITGNTGKNTLDGGIGADTLIGGAGNDAYVVDQAGDVIIENLAQGTDTVFSAVSFVLGANLEHLVLTGALDTDGTGNSLTNSITGNAGVNTLDGGTGNDVLAGGDGDDTYIIDSSDIVNENVGGAGGVDTIYSSVSIDLTNAGLFTGDIENVVLTGSQSNYAIGNALVNTLTGNTASNTLDGGAGADTLIGDAGDDVYVVDDVGDTIVELLSSGTDEVQSSITFSLAAFTEVENLTLTGGAAIDGTGNDLDNTLTGNSGANKLTGGLGNDTYVVGAGDTVVEGVGEGTDTIMSSVTFDLSTNGVNVENLTLTGALDIDGTGDAGDNTLTGNLGKNTLSGGLGNDTYYIGAGDRVIEGVGGGIDTIVSTATFALTPGDEVENLTLIGTANINATGDNSNNVITGNSGANTLTGLGGADTLEGGTGIDRLIGGLGDDTFYVDVTGDVVVEIAGEGTDIVHSTAASYTLSANIEELYLDGTGNINGTGNAGTQTLTGNSGDNSLDGAAGADTMVGGLGDDTYAVDNIGDVVNENPGEGTDTVRSSITYSIAALLNIENIVLTGTAAINATGNAGNNTLVGNSGVNTLTGGLGDDTYIVTSDDTVIEGVGEGIDTLIVTITSGSYTVPANFENIILIGNGNVGLTGDLTSNTLTGNAGRNTLDGGGGADYLAGGKGNDTYIVDDTLDQVVELVGEGTDVVRSSATFTLGDNVENLILTGTGNIDGIGNAQDNTIIGNDGDNTLDGGLGTDKLSGGKGNDAYIIDTLRDKVTDTGGIDTIFTALTYTLGNTIERLDLTGGSDVNGTGNNLINIIAGNTGGNVLKGLNGADILYGGGDMQADGTVVVTLATGNDTLDGGAGADTMTGFDGDDTYFVDNSGDVIFDDAIMGGDDVLNVAANFVVGATNRIETINITGKLAYSLVADDGDNNITGNIGANNIQALDGNDTIAGGAGNDRLDGGAGDDTLFGDEGANILTGGTGADLFVFESATAFDANDQITDFNPGDGDAIDISDIMSGFDPLNDTLSDFVRLQEVGNNTLLRIDVDGAANGSKFVTIAVLQDVTGLTGEVALVASGNLII